MLDKVEENCGKNADEVLADSGYQSGENLKDVEARGSTPYIAKNQGEKLSEETVSEQVIWTGEDHLYECLSGRQLPVKNRPSDGGTLVFIPDGFCDGCPLQGECQLYKRRENKTITIMPEENRIAFVKNIQRLRSDEGQAVYRRLGAIVEPVFGNIKTNKAMRILVKGRKKVAAWWKMAATAHNIEKVIGRMAVAG